MRGEATKVVTELNRKAHFPREPDQLDRITQVAFGQFLGCRQRRVAVEREQVVHSRAAVALHELDELCPVVRRARQVRERKQW